MESIIVTEEHYRRYNFNYSGSFVGKSKKIKKCELMTESIEQFILNEAKKEIQEFFPELLC